ncbi:MAG: NAD(P)/FAD-dependent oxidoreductase, partial [Elusimicrobia bacterium]|nr:NAD(P)/FAD-dependent oxidoreductase [Elusimicrobiota bacterium]
MISKIWDSIIVGGGPAGLAAGLYLSRMGFKTLLIENSRPGGQAYAIGRIHNYPGFPGGISAKILAKRFLDHAREWGLNWRLGRVVELRRTGNYFSARFGRTWKISRSAIVSTGASFNRLALPREKFLKGRGLFYGPPPEISRFKRRVVAVLGGGDGAFHEALALSRIAKGVQLIYRGKPSAAAHLLAQVSSTGNITQHQKSRITRLLGNRRLRALEIKNARPKPLKLKVDALFVLIGKTANDQLWRRLKNQKGLFVAGDAHQGIYRQVAIASGDG